MPATVKYSVPIAGSTTSAMNFSALYVRFFIPSPKYVLPSAAQTLTQLQHFLVNLVTVLSARVFLGIYWLRSWMLKRGLYQLAELVVVDVSLMLTGEESHH
jgi:hypothetical protein